MSLLTARKWLLWIFLIGLIASGSSLVISFLKREIYSDELLSAAMNLLRVYSVHLSVIIFGLFAQGKAGDRKVQRDVGSAAIVVAMIWNGVILWRFAAFMLILDDSIGELEEYVRNVAPNTAFLVAGALSFFFASKSD